MILGIVGSEAAKFTKLGKSRAELAIQELIREYKPEAVSSGHCHLGGIDIWAEVEAKRWEAFDPDLIFPPKSLQWSTGFKPRNLQIAQASDVVVCISVDSFPKDYVGMRFPNCYHCIQRGDYIRHIKSGGCWTAWKAKDLGKVRRLVVVQNY